VITKTLRLPVDLASAIRNVGKEEHLDESVAMRKLLHLGYAAYVAEKYRSGRISLRTAAEEMGLPLSEAMDALSRMGIPGNVSADDTLHSLQSLRRQGMSTKAPRMQKQKGSSPQKS
jgi:predicted HTH domain antitoxin